MNQMKHMRIGILDEVDPHLTERLNAAGHACIRMGAREARIG